MSSCFVRSILCVHIVRWLLFSCKRKQWITLRYVCRVNNTFGLHVNNGANDKLAESNLASDFRIAMEMWLDNISIHGGIPRNAFSLSPPCLLLCESGVRDERNIACKWEGTKKVPCDYKYVKNGANAAISQSPQWHFSRFEPSNKRQQKKHNSHCLLRCSITICSLSQ